MAAVAVGARCASTGDAVAEMSASEMAEDVFAG